jgi:PAB1-binding protein PBP1
VVRLSGWGGSVRSGLQRAMARRVLTPSSLPWATPDAEPAPMVSVGSASSAGGAWPRQIGPAHGIGNFASAQTVARGTWSGRTGGHPLSHCFDRASHSDLAAGVPAHRTPRTGGPPL